MKIFFSVYDLLWLLLMHKPFLSHSLLALSILIFLPDNIPRSTCSTPAGVQGQVGWGSKQPGLFGDVPGHGKEIEMR